jgi:hypothetical protein
MANYSNIKTAYNSYTLYDKEYTEALQRKAEYYAQKAGLELDSYPFDYEITQWGLKKELATRDLAKHVKEL